MQPNKPTQRHSSDFLTLQYSTKIVLEPEAPEDDILKYKIELVPLVGEDGEPGESFGHFSVWRFNISANQNRAENSLLFMFDDDSAEAADLYHALFSPGTEDFREEIGGDIALHSDVLYFQMANFPEEFHRESIILAAAERIIQTIGSGCAYAALWLGDEPYPRSEEYTMEDVLSFWESQKESESFWGRINFKRIPETFFLVRNLALRSSAITEILEHDTPDD